MDTQQNRLDLIYNTVAISGVGEESCQKRKSDEEKEVGRLCKTLETFLVGIAPHAFWGNSEGSCVVQCQDSLTCEGALEIGCKDLPSFFLGWARSKWNYIFDVATEKDDYTLKLQITIGSNYASDSGWYVVISDRKTDEVYACLRVMPCLSYNYTKEWGNE